MSAKMSGIVTQRHAVLEAKYGEEVGVIKGDDGGFYVFLNGHVYRDGSRASVGDTVTFDVLSFSYATNISNAQDKKAGKP